MRKTTQRDGLGAAAVEYALVAVVLALPVLLASFGYGKGIGYVYVHLLENVSGVVARLGG